MVGATKENRTVPDHKDNNIYPHETLRKEDNPVLPILLKRRGQQNACV